MSAFISYWEKKHFFNYDIIIIGSGIVGLNAAIYLKTKSPNLSVVVLERGFLPSGASTKNAGFACFGSVSELIEQEKIIGTTGLYNLIDKRWNGLLKLRKLLGDSSISFNNYGGYELFKPLENELSSLCVSKIGHYNNILKEISGKKDVFKTAPHKIAEFGVKGIEVLLENTLEAQIDPGKMMFGLLDKARELGIVVFNSCSVAELREEGDRQIIVTPDGNFSCKRVLLCNNAFVKDLLPSLDIVPGRGQVIITKPIKDLKIKGTFHYDKGYYYFRNIDGRVLLGGGRNLNFKAEETTEFGNTELVQNALLKLLSEVILPDYSFEIEQNWSGIMAFGSSIDPIIKAIKPNVFCAVRCNGMGIAMGTQTGEDAARLVLDSL
ncbi:FAD-binding oxidoreductase [Pedobacter foliorum]|uniref:NAD(P)/FAD-dependent oxidoreductase n=1 Tax=Pedobacter foliorum TaxID=2739058 RepID=UPI00156383C1|nr:FAD-dependent oxidoreductase [Pedobacter foliorum]NRF38451.1 FAD-binding oxidoreductase [Pedobacter foliorum]